VDPKFGAIADRWFGGHGLVAKVTGSTAQEGQAIEGKTIDLWCLEIWKETNSRIFEQKQMSPGEVL
jgi:hypothetical protein